MSQSVIHLIGPAGSCRSFFKHIDVTTAGELIALVQDAVGDDYRITGDETIIDADEDELHGGRTDDQRRADEITQALSDSQVAAIVTLRGGAWFTRILPRIDFQVLDRRETKIAIFGFSELTTLVNIVGEHPSGLGIYDMGPAFLAYGLRHYAATRTTDEQRGGLSPHEWAERQLPARFGEFFRTCTALIEGRETPPSITATLARGDLPDRFDATFVGGNLTALSPMIGSMFESSIAPERRWLLLEDYNDKPERLDRYLSHLTLSNYWDRCEGVLLGDFHQEDRDLTPAVLNMLEYHLQEKSAPPILTTHEVGHVWPMAPLPLHTPACVQRADDNRFTITWPSCAVQTVS